MAVTTDAKLSGMSVKRKPMHVAGPLRPALNSVSGWVAIALLRLIRWGDRRLLANCFGLLMRRLGPWLPNHHIGRANLKAAFPEKSDGEIEHILGRVWDNLGRVAAEFAHLDRIQARYPDALGCADITYDPQTLIMLEQIRNGGRSNLCFAAHIGNWEIPALIATAAGCRCHLLYRRPNNPVIGKIIMQLRSSCMGTLVPANSLAPRRFAKALSRGRHVGLLADQRYGRGVEVTFFGRTCKVSPLPAWLARQFDCPIRGFRVTRLGNRNAFFAELTQPIDPPRDSDGKIDIQGTMQVITSVIEGWIREDPGQWLWLHDRWR